MNDVPVSFGTDMINYVKECRLGNESEHNSWTFQLGQRMST